MKVSRFSMAALAVATVVVAGSGFASAANYFGPGGTLTPNQTNVNQILYHNYEDVFHADGTALGVDEAIAQGDIIVGILNIDQISPPGTTVGSTFGNGSASINEITGVFAQTVTGVVNGAGGPGSTGTTYTFGDLSGAQLSQNYGGITDLHTYLAAGEMFAFYVDSPSGAAPTNKFAADGSVTLQQSFDTATNGSLLFSAGLAAEPGIGEPNTGYFGATVTDATAQNFTISALGGLNIVQNNTGDTFNTVFDTHTVAETPVGLIVASAIQNNQTQGSAWAFQSHDPADVSVFVPLPASAWTGLSMLGLLGGAAFLRKRKLAKA